MVFTLADAALTSLFMASIFYGLHLNTFLRTLDALRHGASQWTLLVVACCMFVLGSFSISILFKINHDAFVTYTGPGGADARLSEINDWVNPAKVRLGALCSH